MDDSAKEELKKQILKDKKELETERTRLWERRNKLEGHITTADVAIRQIGRELIDNDSKIQYIINILKHLAED